MRRVFALGFSGAIVVFCTANCVSCAPQSRMGLDLLYSPDGVEYDYPTARCLERLEAMSPDEQRREINRLSDICNRRRGYSHVLAATVLFCVAENPSSHHMLTEDAVQALARNVIRLSGAWSHTSPAELARASEYFDVLAPRFVVGFDGHSYELYKDRLPHGWRALEAEAILDGQVLPQTAKGIPFERFGKVVVNVSGHLRSEGALGRHTVVYRLVLEAPNGTVATVEQRETITVFADGPPR